MVAVRAAGQGLPTFGRDKDESVRLIDGLEARDAMIPSRSGNHRWLGHELVTLFLAGHETTSNALAWTLYLLARNPEALAKLEAEVARVVGDRSCSTAGWTWCARDRRFGVARASP